MGVSKVSTPSAGYGERPALSAGSTLKGNMIDAQKFASKLMAKPLAPLHNIGSALGALHAPKPGKAKY
jgi:hypothetical protein